MATTAEILAKSKQLFDAGDVEGAKRLARIAKERGGDAAQPSAATVDPKQAGRRAYLSSMYQSSITPPERVPQSPAEVFAGSIADGVSFGLADEAAAAIGSALGDGDYDTILARLRQQKQNQQEDAPKAAMAGELAGAIAMPFGAIKAATAAKSASPALRTAKAIGMGAGTGAAMSGLYGFGAGEGGFGERLDGALDASLLGAGLGALIPGAGALLQRGLNKRATNRAISEIGRNAPSTEAQRAVARAAYKAVDDANVAIEPGAFASRVGGMTADMTASGMRTGVGRELSPKAAGLMDSMADVATDPRFSKGLPFREVETLRKLAQVPAADRGNDLERALGSRAIESLDDFIAKLDPTQVTQGNAAEIGPLIAAARSAYQKAAKSQTVESAIEAGEQYVSGAASGIRNKFSTMLKNKKKYLRGYTPLEIEAMRRVVNGSLAERAIVLGGSGLGRLASATAGYSSGGMGGLLVGGAVGAGVQKMADAIVRRRADQLRAVVANGGSGALPVASSRTPKFLEALLQRANAATSGNAMGRP